MKRSNLEITIIPAKFREKTSDGKNIIEVYLGDLISEYRVFDSYSLAGITDPKYLFIGIMINKNTMSIKFIDANEYYYLFKEKRWIL